MAGTHPGGGGDGGENESKAPPHGDLTPFRPSLAQQAAHPLHEAGAGNCLRQLQLEQLQRDGGAARRS